MAQLRAFCELQVLRVSVLASQLQLLGPKPYLVPFEGSVEWLKSADSVSFVSSPPSWGRLGQSPVISREAFRTIPGARNSLEVDFSIMRAP